MLHIFTHVFAPAQNLCKCCKFLHFFLNLSTPLDISICFYIFAYFSRVGPRRKGNEHWEKKYLQNMIIHIQVKWRQKKMTTDWAKSYSQGGMKTQRLNKTAPTEMGLLPTKWGTHTTGTDNCGTDNCGTENCGTENCGTETCGIICFFLFHIFLCVHMLFSAMLAYSRDFSRMYTWFTYFC